MTVQETLIRPVRPGDAPGIADIYNHYVVNTTVTFEETPLSEGEMEERIRDISGRWPYLVHAQGDEILGYAYADRFRARCAYRHTVETTLYVRHGFHGRGIGSALYGGLIAALRKTDARAVIGCVAMPNDASVRLHRRLGFEQVAHLRNVGRKFDRWLDVTYWELELA